MPKIIKGVNEWEFVVVTDDDLDEVMEYAAWRGGRTALHILFRNCDTKILDRILAHKLVSQIQAINLMDSGHGIRKLEGHVSLKSINFGYDSSEFDFSSLPNLEQVGGVWSRKWSGLSECNSLKRFRVSKYKDEFQRIPRLSDLEEVQLIQPVFTSLTGLESAAKLDALDVSLARKLEDISAIVSCSSTLARLNIDGCKSVKDFSCINKMTNLQHLAITNCGAIASISFIEHLRNLKFLSISGTKILDNDLSACMKVRSLRQIGCDDIRTYVPRCKEIKEQLGNSGDRLNLPQFDGHL